MLSGVGGRRRDVATNWRRIVCNTIMYSVSPRQFQGSCFLNSITGVGLQQSQGAVSPSLADPCSTGLV